MRPTVVLFAFAFAAAPAHGAVSDSGLAETDRAFLIQEAQGSEYELSIARLAQAQASRADVKDYAAHVVADHEKAQAALNALLKQKNLAPVTGVTPDDAAKYKGLQALRGPAFDAAYLKEARAVNAQGKQDDIRERRATQDPAVRTLVNGMVSMDTDHLDAAEKLAR